MSSHVIPTAPPQFPNSGGQASHSVVMSLNPNLHPHVGGFNLFSGPNPHSIQVVSSKHFVQGDEHLIQVVPLW